MRPLLPVSACEAGTSARPAHSRAHGYHLYCNGRIRSAALKKTAGASHTVVPIFFGGGRGGGPDDKDFVLETPKSGMPGTEGVVTLILLWHGTIKAHSPETSRIFGGVVRVLITRMSRSASACLWKQPFHLTHRGWKKS